MRSPFGFGDGAVSLLILLGILPGSIYAGQDLRALLTDPSNNWNSATNISFPGSQGFIDATLRWDIYAPPTYAAAVSPATEADVVQAIKLATANNISILATGGRHGYTTTLTQLQDGLAVDLGGLTSIEIDQDAETLTIGGGVKVNDIFNPVYEAGFELQTITSQCPGMVGATLGAGVGRDGGRYGLMIDALKSVRLVTADGHLIEVSKTSYPDLFWALRGAGANFGVVTSATYNLHRIPSSGAYNGTVVNFDMVWPANMTSDYFEALANSYGGSLPAKLSSQAIVLYDAVSNNVQLASNWVYFGPEAEARKLLEPILALQPPVVVAKAVPWNLLANTFLQGTDPANCPRGKNQSIFGLNMRRMSPSTYQNVVEKMAKFYQDHPEGRKSLVSLETFPNYATKAVARDSTAYPWRDTVAHALIILVEAGAVGDAIGSELRRDLVTTSGYGDLSVYVNYARGDETLPQIYGETQLPRLVSLKRKWDPTGVFVYNNAIPTKYP